MMALFSEDLVYTDEHQLHRWTTKSREGYSKMSEFLRKNTSGYTFDKNLSFIAKPDTRTVNLNDLISILKSKDESLLTKNAWMFDGELRLLDGGKIPEGNKIAFNTFPRVGNTFLRKCLEQVTGVCTGDNMPKLGTAM
jgi:hypothetical protein